MSFTKRIKYHAVPKRAGWGWGSSSFFLQAVPRPWIGWVSCHSSMQQFIYWPLEVTPHHCSKTDVLVCFHKGSCGKIKPHIEEPSVYIAKWRKPIWKDYILYDSSCMTFGRRWNYGDSRKISGCHGFGEGGRAEQAECRACKYPIWYCNSGCISLTFVQTHRMYKTHGET